MKDARRKIKHTILVGSLKFGFVANAISRKNKNMYKYYTQYFNNNLSVSEEIDSFLNSFSDITKFSAEGNHAEVVGYVVLGDKLIVTVKRWEMLSK